MRAATVLLVSAGLAVAAAIAYPTCLQQQTRRGHQPPAEDAAREEPDPEFTSDELRGRTIPPFDPDLVDSRPLGAWQVNASAAVMRLDCPQRKSEDPDDAEKLQELRPSYAAAATAASSLGAQLLPSANMVDGKAKQFDDGLYAALDLAVFHGELGLPASAPDLVASVFARLPPGSPARPFLAAALDLAGRDATLDGEERARMKALLRQFDTDEFRSKPISFYTWTRELGRLWRFFRFLQQEFTSPEVPRDLAAALRADPALLAQYRALNAFYGRLTNPLICLPVDLFEEGRPLEEIAAARGASRPTIAFFPPSTSRETELFDRVFRRGIPPGANLMGELVRRIRSGEVDLSPRGGDGWYQLQAHALETLLLPERGQEHEKLLLTAGYKRRLLAAFQALLTKRRETHARQLATTRAAMAPVAPPKPLELKPRLRVEPLATFYLRTARAYAFLESFLEAAVGPGRLAELHGLREGGSRERTIAEELAAMRRLFYGLFFVSCEDLGMRPRLAAGEPADEARDRAEALAWLDACAADPDLSRDTRVSVPVAHDPRRDATRIWATLGVRLARFEAEYALPPRVRPRGEAGWRDPEYPEWRVVPSDYVIPVDEFAEIELRGSSALTREELRRVCDRKKTRERIVEALSR